MPKRILILLFVALLVLVGCDDTGDTNTDAAAAQRFFPSLTNYTVHETESIQQAIAAALGAGALASNPPLAALVERTDTLLSCYRDVGAVDARIYVENVSAANISQARLPLVGALVIINQDRVVNNFTACVTSNPLESVFAQTVEPCTGSGTFEFEGDTITYAYAASDGPLCDLFSGHFAQY